MNTLHYTVRSYSHALDKRVFAADQVPKYIRKGRFIANTDDSKHTGKDWCAFFFDGLGRSEFFGSYGNGLEYYSKHFFLCLRTNSSAQLHNTIKLQNNYSTCSLYLTMQKKAIL